MTTTELIDRAERLLDECRSVLKPTDHWHDLRVDAIDAWKRDLQALKAKCRDGGEYVLTPLGEAIADALDKGAK